MAVEKVKIYQWVRGMVKWRTLVNFVGCLLSFCFVSGCLGVSANCLKIQMTQMMFDGSKYE